MGIARSLIPALLTLATFISIPSQANAQAPQGGGGSSSSSTSEVCGWASPCLTTEKNNYYWQGDVNNYQNGGKAVAKNRDTEYHEYGLVWTPTQLQWTIDGNVVRTLAESNTTVNGISKFPQTPSKIQFSPFSDFSLFHFPLLASTFFPSSWKPTRPLFPPNLSVWPAGIASSPAGTIEWAGGLIDWTETGTQGYFAAYVQWLNVECYDPTKLTFQNASSNSTSRLRERSLGAVEPVEGWVAQTSLWERANEVGTGIESYVYGGEYLFLVLRSQRDVDEVFCVSSSANSTGGQMTVFASNAATIIDSQTATGKNMITKKTSALSNSAVGNWWAKQALGVHVGIIIGAVAILLFVMVALCTCVARRKDKKQYATIANANISRPAAARSDNIPLVEKKYPNLSQSQSRSSSSLSKAPMYSPPDNYNNQYQPQYPSQQQYQQPQQQFGAQRSQGNNFARPQWPDERQGANSPSDYAFGQQQAGYGGGGYGASPQGGQYGQQQQQQYAKALQSVSIRRRVRGLRPQLTPVHLPSQLDISSARSVAAISLLPTHLSTRVVHTSSLAPFQRSSPRMPSKKQTDAARRDKGLLAKERDLAERQKQRAAEEAEHLAAQAAQASASSAAKGTRERAVEEEHRQTVKNLDGYLQAEYKKVTRLEAQLATAADENERLKTQLAGSYSSLPISSTDTLAFDSLELPQARAALASSEVKIAQLRGEVRRANINVDVLKEKVDAVREETEVLKKELEERGKVVAKMEGQIINLETDQKDRAHERRESQLNAEHKVIMDSFAAAQKELAKLKTSDLLTELQADLSERVHSFLKLSAEVLNFISSRAHERNDELEGELSEFKPSNLRSNAWLTSDPLEVAAKSKTNAGVTSITAQESLAKKDKNIFALENSLAEAQRRLDAARSSAPPPSKPGDNLDEQLNKTLQIQLVAEQKACESMASAFEDVVVAIAKEYKHVWKGLPGRSDDSTILLVRDSLLATAKASTPSAQHHWMSISANFDKLDNFIKDLRKSTGEEAQKLRDKLEEKETEKERLRFDKKEIEERLAGKIKEVGTKMKKLAEVEKERNQLQVSKMEVEERLGQKIEELKAKLVEFESAVILSSGTPRKSLKVNTEVLESCSYFLVSASSFTGFTSEGGGRNLAAAKLLAKKAVQLDQTIRDLRIENLSLLLQLVGLPQEMAYLVIPDS
ncbi:hypothetical protein P7C70_g198, partial [Phenoliferia sp. Uapishka_3]